MTAPRPTRPLVSVVIPFRDAGATLDQTLASVRAQTFPDWEALLVDDASQDAGPALAAAAAAGDARFRLLPGTGRGAAAARNIGIAAARGRHIAFLDADDLWHPEKLARQVTLLESGVAPIVFCSYRRFRDGTGADLGTVPARPRLRWADALDGNPIGCLTGIWDSAILGRQFMPEFALQHDYAFWLQLLRTGAEARGLPEVLADYRVRAGSLSAGKLRAAAATWAVLRAEPGLPLPRAALGFARYATGALRRRMAERIIRPDNRGR